VSLRIRVRCPYGGTRDHRLTSLRKMVRQISIAREAGISPCAVRKRLRIPPALTSENMLPIAVMHQQRFNPPHPTPPSRRRNQEREDADIDGRCA
jgi:hypothetical protein